MKLLKLINRNCWACLQKIHCRSFSTGYTLSNDKIPSDGNDMPVDVRNAVGKAYTGDGDNVKYSFPSDDDERPPRFFNSKEEEKIWYRDQARHSFRPKLDPKKTSILLFPGQGSQFVGMGESLLKYPNVSKMYKIAKDILGYDLLDVCTKGPLEKLSKTVYCQPAIFVTSLAAVEKLRDEHPQAIENCVTAAGFSIGEFAALVFAGAMKFEDALEVVKVRATAMQKASEEVDSGMMTVFLGPSNKISYAMLTARKYCEARLNIEQPVCRVANYLFTECKVIAGHTQALDFLDTNKVDFGIKRTKRLQVSGAFHTPLMQPAREKVTKALRNVWLEEPIVYVHSNVTSHKFRDIERMRKDLAKQVTSPVKWEQIMHVVYSRSPDEGFPVTYEVGPGRQLGTLLKMTNKRAFGSYVSVDV